MTRILSVTLASVLCCFVLLTEGRTTSQLSAADEKQPKEVPFAIDDDEDNNAEESRFLSGSGTGGSSSAAINNLITRKQQMLESLRPTGSYSGTSTGAANVIYVNAGSTTGTATGTAAAGGGASVAGALLPQIIGGALSGGTRRRSPTNRNRNSNRNRNRKRKGNGNRNRKRKRPQVFLIRP